MNTSTTTSTTTATEGRSAAERPPTSGPADDHRSRRTRRHLTLVPSTPPADRDQRGITTAEYAVGTAAGAGLAGLLYTLLTGGLGEHLITTFFDHALSLLGVG